MELPPIPRDLYMAASGVRLPAPLLRAPLRGMWLRQKTQELNVPWGAPHDGVRQMPCPCQPRLCAPPTPPWVQAPGHRCRPRPHVPTRLLIPYCPPTHHHLSPACQHPAATSLPSTHSPMPPAPPAPLQISGEAESSPHAIF